MRDIRPSYLIATPRWNFRRQSAATVASATALTLYLSSRDARIDTKYRNIPMYENSKLHC